MGVKGNQVTLLPHNNGVDNVIMHSSDGVCYLCERRKGEGKTSLGS